MNPSISGVEKAGWGQVVRDNGICNLQGPGENGFSEFPKPLKPILDTQETKAPAILVGRPLQSTLSQLGFFLQEALLDCVPWRVPKLEWTCQVQHSWLGEVIKTNLPVSSLLCRALYNCVPCFWTAHSLYSLCPHGSC